MEATLAILRRADPDNELYHTLATQIANLHDVQAAIVERVSNPQERQQLGRQFERQAEQMNATLEQLSTTKGALREQQKRIEIDNRPPVILRLPSTALRAARLNIERMESLRSVSKPSMEA